MAAPSHQVLPTLHRERLQIDRRLCSPGHFQRSANFHSVESSNLWTQNAHKMRGRVTIITNLLWDLYTIISYPAFASCALQSACVTRCASGARFATEARTSCRRSWAADARCGERGARAPGHGVLRQPRVRHLRLCCTLITLAIVVRDLPPRGPRVQSPRQQCPPT